MSSFREIVAFCLATGVVAVAIPEQSVHRPRNAPSPWQSSASISTGNYAFKISADEYETWRAQHRPSDDGARGIEQRANYPINLAYPSCHRSGSWAKNESLTYSLNLACDSAEWLGADDGDPEHILEFQSVAVFFAQFDDQNNRLRNAAGDEMSLTMTFKPGPGGGWSEEVCKSAFKLLVEEKCHGDNSDTRGGTAKLVNSTGEEIGEIGLDVTTDNCGC